MGDVFSKKEGKSPTRNPTQIARDTNLHTNKGNKDNLYLTDNMLDDANQRLVIDLHYSERMIRHKY